MKATGRDASAHDSFYRALLVRAASAFNAGPRRPPGTRNASWSRHCFNQSNSTGNAGSPVFVCSDSHCAMPGDRGRNREQRQQSRCNFAGTVKQAPVFEIIKFSIPENASVHKFDEITVMLLPDLEHEFVAQKSQFSNFNYFRDNTDNHGLLNSVLQTRRGNQP
jgi:hypothetical protein